MDWREKPDEKRTEPQGMGLCARYGCTLQRRDWADVPAAERSRAAEHPHRRHVTGQKRRQDARPTGPERRSTRDPHIIWMYYA